MVRKTAKKNETQVDLENRIVMLTNEIKGKQIEFNKILKMESVNLKETAKLIKEREQIRLKLKAEGGSEFHF
jgi:hypothetical protein